MEEKLHEGVTELLAAPCMITNTLREIDETGVVPSWISNNPGKFVRDFYESWHHNGHMIGGRYRNSVRRMRHTWLTGENLVRSLHAKLIGRVKLSKEDARRLIDLFLSRWEFVGPTSTDDRVTADGYLPFPARDRKRLCRLLLKSMFAGLDGQNRQVLLLPRRREENLVELHDHPKLIEQFAWKADAFIIMSRQRTVIGPSQPAAMMAFWHMINDHFLYCQKNIDQENINIWILDAGSYSVEDADAFACYYNVGFLAMLFRMIRKFSSFEDTPDVEQSALVKKLWIAETTGAQERWEWLVRTSIVAIHNLERSHVKELYSDVESDLGEIRLKDTNVTIEHLYPSAIPNKWNKKLRKFYAANKGEEIKNMTISISYRNKLWGDNDSPFRYFAHKAIAGIPDVEEDIKWGARNVELGSPGQDYDESFRLLYLGSKFRLRKNKTKEISDESISFAYLRKLGFDLLKIDEFISMY